MTDTAVWLSEVHGQVDAAQSVLDEIGRGLAVAEAVEAASERAFPILRKVLGVLALAAIAFAVYRLVSGRQRPAAVRPDDPVPDEADGPATG